MFSGSKTIAEKITKRISIMIFILLLVIGITVDVIVRKFNQSLYEKRIKDSIALMDKGRDNYFG
ncbi:MAG: hypothetical protein J6Y01_06980, partial [Spirochaetales bacterium]|nr:hypothetical protein [Spirochaetales bacterium]